MRLIKGLGKEELPIEQSGQEIIVPIGNRAYIKFTGRSRNNGIKALQNARL